MIKVPLLKVKIDSAAYFLMLELKNVLANVGILTVDDEMGFPKL